VVKLKIKDSRKFEFFSTRRTLSNLAIETVSRDGYWINSSCQGVIESLGVALDATEAVL
jgi:hypothetical protein